MEKTAGQTLKSYCMMVFLAAISALSFELLVFPNEFAPAGINGLATMVQHLFHFNVGYMSIIINIPLVLVVYWKVDRDFALKSLAYVLSFSVCLLLLDRVDLSSFIYYTDNGNSTILGPIAAGVISGAVYGYAIRQNGSTGGTDLIAVLVRKRRPEMSLVWLIFGLNAVVAVLSYFVYDYQFEPVILCLIFSYLSSKISDDLLKGGKRAVKFEVVTDHPEALSAHIFKELQHGVTVLPALGMYSETQKHLLVCVINRHQIVKFQEILSQYPGTFAYVSEVNETWGNFKRVE